MTIGGMHAFLSGMVGTQHGAAWAATCIARVYRLW